MTELTLAYEFFKTGLFAVGGGLATIPFLRNISERYNWYTIDELTNIIAIGESTPGPIGVNMATYAGINAVGFHGGIIATLALVFPSIIVITIISRFLNNFKNNKMIGSVFSALRPAGAGLITAAMFPVFLSSVVNITDMRINYTVCILYAIFLPLCFLNNRRKKPLHPILFIILGAVLGIIFGERLEV